MKTLTLLMLLLSFGVAADNYNIVDADGNVVGSLSLSASTSTTTTTTVTPPTPTAVDSDGDGVNDNVDQCANTPAGTQVDSNGCPIQVVSNGDYCSGSYTGVQCDPALNQDDWWAYSGDQTLYTSAEGPLSLPFTTRTSSSDGGMVSVTTYEGAFIDGESFRMWISETPGGVPLPVSDECSNYMAQARGGMYWTQNPRYSNNSRFCYLSNTARVLYLNFEACSYTADGLNCLPNSRIGGYQFNTRRSYRAY